MLPPHCLNVFVPLVDLTPALGSTRFFAGSHALSVVHEYSDATALPEIAPYVVSCLTFVGPCLLLPPLLLSPLLLSPLHYCHLLCACLHCSSCCLYCSCLHSFAAAAASTTHTHKELQTPTDLFICCPRPLPLSTNFLALLLGSLVWYSLCNLSFFALSLCPQSVF